MTMGSFMPGFDWGQFHGDLCAYKDSADELADLMREFIQVTRSGIRQAERATKSQSELFDGLQGLVLRLERCTDCLGDSTQSLERAATGVKDAVDRMATLASPTQPPPPA